MRATQLRIAPLAARLGHALRRAALGCALPTAVALSLLTPGVSPAHPSLEEAEAAVETALTEQPEDPALQLARGQVATRAKDWDAALAAYARARTLGADPAYVAVLEGTIYLQLDWPKTAKLRFDAALAHSPERADARLGRARAWMQLGQPGQAETDFAAAFARLPKPRPSDVLRRRDALLADGRPAEAMAALDDGIARLGLVPSLQLAAVDLALAAEDYDAALGRLDRLLEASGPNPSWLEKRGAILERSGRLPDAKLAYADALADVQRRSARRGSARLEALEGSLVAALDRVQAHEEKKP